MQNLTKFTVQRDDDEYEISLGWDNGAFVEGHIEFNISALKRNIETREEIEPLSATVAIVPNPGHDPESDEVPSPFLQIVVRNEIIGHEETINVPLSTLFEESQVVDLIPAYMFSGDPFTGCLIRSGISTTVAQIIDCKNETAGILPWFWDRVRQLGKCLLVSIPDMSAKMVRKSVRCILRFGF
jgi:hypothetical protein